MFSPFSRRPVEPYVKPRDMISYSRKRDEYGHIYSGVEFAPEAQAAYGFITQTNIFNPKLELAEIIYQVFSEFSEQVQLSTSETWLTPTQLGTEDTLVLTRHFKDKMSAAFPGYNEIELANICFRSRKSESNPTYNLYCIINALMINARYRCYGENALIDPPLPAPSLAEARRCRPITIEPCLDKVGKKAFKQTLTMQCAKILPPGHTGAGIGTLDYPACVCEIEMIIPLRPFLANDTAFVQPCKLHIRAHEGLEPLLEMLKNQIAQEGRIALFTITKAFEGYQSLPMIQ